MQSLSLPPSAKVGINFADKRRSLGWYSQTSEFVLFLNVSERANSNYTALQTIVCTLQRMKHAADSLHQKRLIGNVACPTYTSGVSERRNSEVYSRTAFPRLHPTAGVARSSLSKMACSKN
jgi:hypothetical protein